MTDKELNISGFLSLHDAGEAMDILFVHTITEPLAEYLMDEINNICSNSNNRVLCFEAL